ncbi:MAG: chromosome segregation protein SMC [Rhodobacteraceae bacterium]|nr:chromosome segregation protein SMC [Paracoccaceae bacterium]
MHFTRLRLNGFKSFVDPTELTIATGLTGVVGPNGCGKSNLLEALRWVMGENRPTAMRGEGMEDVIFAGAATRPARNFAEVTLTVDNSERLAPASFNDSEIIEVVRRITRDAGSAFKCNSKEVRARDVQMLFADASTGSHSPALVRQGQISELINARPKARRRVLEEAAGISGLYQRRHEAELKLKATEANLERVEDLVEQLAQQLGQLARQAKQAARYRAIGAELRVAEGLLLWRRWREADQALNSARAGLAMATTEAARAEAASRKAAKAREEAEGELPDLREEDAIAGAVAQRLVVERDTLDEQDRQAQAQIAALENRLAQLARDRDREAGLTADAAGTLDRLATEAAGLEQAGAGHAARLDDAAAAAREAGEILTEREADLGTLNEDVARLSARHQAVERLLADSRKTEARAAAEAERAREAVAEARRAASAGAAAQAEAEAAQTDARAALAAAEAALVHAEEARAEIQGEEADARAERSEAAGEAKALAAEVAALGRLVARDDAAGTQIVDETRVTPGYERAFGAALGDDLKAPRIADHSGAGWELMPDYAAAPALPDGAIALAGDVEAPAELRRRLAQVGVIDPADAVRLQPLLAPGQRLVSTAGDLWRWDGYCSPASAAPSAAALRLEQINRLAELRGAHETAEARALAAAESHVALSSALSAATEAEKSARLALRGADTALAEAGRAQARAEAERHLAEGKAESLELAVARHDEAAMAARQQVAEAARQAADLDDLDEARERVALLRTAVEAARIAMMSRRAAHDEVKRDGETRAARLEAIAKERRGWTERLETAESRIADLAARHDATRADLVTARTRPDEIAARRAELAEALERAEARKAAAADAVAGAESRLRAAAAAEREAERSAGETREARARAETRVEAATEAAAAAAERIAEETDRTPEELLETLDADPAQMPPSDEIEATIGRLRRARESLGAVNLRAEEDARAVQEEHDTLVAEKTDLESATAKLRAGIAGLNREGRERLLTAFEQVNANFSNLFTHLFGGGEARLSLVESDDPLEAGLEILCQPPGKKLSTLSLLSGGEQTLTALALIFAVFLANPAPICVLDEVDAPLDDANVTRMCDLLDEMTRRTDTRFLIITHHAVTMSRMDRLFGVTMAEQGVSQLVSVDLKKAEALVA